MPFNPLYVRSFDKPLISPQEVESVNQKNALGRIDLQNEQLKQQVLSNPDYGMAAQAQASMGQHKMEAAQNAGKLIGEAAMAVANSQDPVNAAHSILGHPLFAQAWQAVGGDPNQIEQMRSYVSDPQTTRQHAIDLARQFGVNPNAGQTTIPQGAVVRDANGNQLFSNPKTADPIEQARLNETIRHNKAQEASGGDSGRPQLITRPAPDSGEGMVQDWTVDLKTQQLKPVGSPYPASGTGAAQLGSREGVMFQRVVSSANEAASALKNISELPVSTSTGFFGIGGSPGASAIGSTFGVLRNKIAPQAVQDYNTMLAGVGRSLSTIETAGLAPNGSLTHSMDSINLREGDTELTKLRKLAEMRQIIEKGIEPNLSNPRLPPEQKELIRGIVSSVIEAIPYTQHDITELQRRQQKEPEITLQDLISQKGLRPGTATANKRVKVDANGDVIQ